MPAAKQQQRRGNRRHDHARPYERLLHTKRRRQPRGNRQRGHAGEHVAKAHDRVDATELLERSRRLHDSVVERVDDAPGHAQDNLADKGHAHVRCPHINQTSRAHGHECHEQRFEADEARRQAERNHGAQHRAHTAGRREPAHPFDTDVQDIAVEERLQRIEGTVAKVREEDDAEQQGEDTVGEDCLDACREGDAGERAGVGALAGSDCRCTAVRGSTFTRGDANCLRPKAPAGNERQYGKDHHEHEHRARRRGRRDKAAQCGANDDAHV